MMFCLFCLATLLGTGASAGLAEPGRQEEPAFFDPTSPAVLLSDYPAVQNELEVSDEQRAGVRKVRDRWGRGELTEDQALLELCDLLRPAQFERLKQVMWHVRGGAALRDPALRESLDLTEKQGEQIGAIWRRESTRLREALKTARFKSDRDRRASIIAFTRSAGEKMLGVLTDEQRKELAALRGPGFEVSKLFAAG